MQTVPVEIWKDGVSYPHAEWECYGAPNPATVNIRRRAHSRAPVAMSRALNASVMGPCHPSQVEIDPSACAAPCKIESGDFVQFKRWFNDHWAEVIHGLGEPGEQMIYYVEYAEGGRTRFVGWASESHEAVRRVVKADQVLISAALKDARTRFERSLYVGRGGPVVWPTPLGREGNATRSHPERHPTL